MKVDLIIEAHYLTLLIAALETKGIMALGGSGVVDVDVAIVGGGIGGPALALALQKVGITSVAVFERDASHDERSQGYGLTSAPAPCPPCSRSCSQLAVLVWKELAHDEHRTPLTGCSRAPRCRRNWG